MYKRGFIVALYCTLTPACGDNVQTTSERGTTTSGGSTWVTAAPAESTGEASSGSTVEPTGEPMNGSTSGPDHTSTGDATSEGGESTISGSAGSDDTTGGPFCGDGFFDPGEQCDDGNASDLDTCLSTCTLPVCGDGIVSFGEQCDDGNTKNNDACTNACDLSVCGDAIAGPGEECDDGNDDDDDACSNACALPVCGDGVLGPGEACDDGNDVDDDACSNACAPVSCGDGVVQVGEACDAGGESAACNTNCTAIACGDGVVNATAGEACDGLGETMACDADCTPASCGDGHANAAAGEVCDAAGPSATCDADCTAVACGDGAVNAAAGEFCDTLVELASCDLDCTAAVCGDGVLNASAGESCDTGGETPVCDGNCTDPFCGDGTLNLTAGEACDDGNVQNNDACSSTCYKFVPVSVTTGQYAACALYDKGIVRCWGADGENGSAMSVGDFPGEMPPVPLNIGAKVTQISVGGHHACALVEDGSVRCWGEGQYGQLGYGSTGDLYSPVSNVNVGSQATQVVAGSAHTCALIVGGTVRCWGLGGWLGAGHTNNIGDGNNMPPPDVPGINQVTQIVAGDRHTCTLHTDGMVRCWGYNQNGQLGLGSTGTIGDGPGEMPPAPAPLGFTVAQLAAGFNHTCALSVAGSVRCWGANGSGQLGIGNTTTIGDGPGEMPPPGVNFGESWAAQVVAGDSHSCAMLSSGGVKCWGNPEANGYGGNQNVLSPAMATKLNLGGEPKHLAAHLGHVTCAFLSNNTLRCWGDGQYGQLGYGNFMDQPIPLANTPVPF